MRTIYVFILSIGLASCGGSNSSGDANGTDADSLPTTFEPASLNLDSVQSVFMAKASNSYSTAALSSTALHAAISPSKKNKLHGLKEGAIEEISFKDSDDNELPDAEVTNVESKGEDYVEIDVKFKKKISLCTKRHRTITVAEPAVKMHVNNGATIGACAGDTDETSSDETIETFLAHKRTKKVRKVTEWDMEDSQIHKGFLYAYKKPSDGFLYKVNLETQEATKIAHSDLITRKITDQIPSSSTNYTYEILTGESNLFAERNYNTIILPGLFTPNSNVPSTYRYFDYLDQFGCLADPNPKTCLQNASALNPFVEDYIDYLSFYGCLDYAQHTTVTGPGFSYNIPDHPGCLQIATDSFTGEARPQTFFDTSYAWVWNSSRTGYNFLIDKNDTVIGYRLIVNNLVAQENTQYFLPSDGSSAIEFGNPDDNGRPWFTDSTTVYTNIRNRLKTVMKSPNGDLITFEYTQRYPEVGKTELAQAVLATITADVGGNSRSFVTQSISVKGLPLPHKNEYKMNDLPRYIPFTKGFVKIEDNGSGDLTATGLGPTFGAERSSVLSR
jgi:hypothetical protein